MSTTTMPEDIYGRDSALPDLTASEPTLGRLYDSPPHELLAARRVRVGRFSRRTDGASRRIWAVLQHQQSPEPDRHGDESPGDAATGDPQPDVPESAVQPRRCDLDPADAVRHRMASRARLQPQRPARDLVAGDADDRIRRIAGQQAVAQQRHQHRPADDAWRRDGVHPSGHTTAQFRLFDDRAEEQRR